MSSESSTIFELQKDLFNKVDNNLIMDIHGRVMIVHNITATNFKGLAFIVNNPKYTSSVELMDISVYIEADLQPTPINGLTELVKAAIAHSDAQNYLLQNNICRPFADGFQNNITITELVCLLATYDENTPDILNYTTSDPINNQLIGLFSLSQLVSQSSGVVSTARPLPALKFSIALMLIDHN